jgi:hypothetical protein
MDCGSLLASPAPTPQQAVATKRQQAAAVQVSYSLEHISGNRYLPVDE